MHVFNYSFLKREIPGNLVGITGIISDFANKEEFRKLQYEKTFEKMRQKAIIESVKGSNAIEGIVTTDDRIHDIVAGAKATTHDEFEILGYKDALKLINESHEQLDIDETFILKLHKMMEQHNDPKGAGKYKSKNNYVMEYSADGRSKIRFSPVPAKDVKDAMQQMLLAYYAARQDSGIPQLFLIPCVILDFLCIHPFVDGNGRISRLLTLLLLYNSGYDVGKYVSIEGNINKYKESYYDALKDSSNNWHENKNNYMPFVINFLQILYRCYKDMDDSFMEISLKKAKKSERVETILKSAIVPISKADIMEKLPDVSVKTVELTLSKMLKESKIIKIGTYRDARYVARNAINASKSK